MLPTSRHDAVSLPAASMTSQCDGGGGGGGGPVATASGWPAPPAARDGDVRAADDSYHAWTQATQATQGEIRNWACDVTLDAAGGRAARERADCDAIYRQLAVKNGQINRMTRQQLHDKLDELKLDSRCAPRPQTAIHSAQ